MPFDRFSSSLDGGYLENDSISCTEGTYFSRLLQENDAVIVSGSALLEDPTLVTAEAGAKQPLRIVLTSTLQLPPDASIFDTSVAPKLVIASEEAVVSDSASSNKGKSGQTMESKLQERGVEVVGVQELDFDSVLEICYARGFCSVLVDGRGDGRSSIAKQALEEKVVQKLVVDVAHKLCGHSKIGPGFTVDKDLEYLERVSSKMCGDHVIIEGYFRNNLNGTQRITPPK
jgi:diaminohydroxyphosphoribosylaminopyrimidine deaminase/5-amino-6-(5-phosphoribosylamino)uracil reductase